VVWCDPRTDKPLPPQNRFHRGQKLPICIKLEDVSSCSVAQSSRHYIRIIVLTYQEYGRAWNESGYSMGGFDSIQCRTPDIEDNQVRFQFFGLLNCF